MKISEDLLTRYSLGECTAEERAIVERWLDTNEGMDKTPYQTEFGQIRKRLWNRLLRHTINTNGHRKGAIPLTRYAAAACLILGVMGIVVLQVTKSISEERNFENDDLSAARLIHSDGVTVSLMPESRVEWGSDRFGVASFKVCGYTILRNTGRKETDLNVSSYCSGKSRSSKLLKIRRGETYHVLAGPVADNQLLILDTGDIEMLHPAHRARVNAVFQHKNTLKI